MLAAKYLSVKMQFCKGVASENGFQWNVVASYMLKKKRDWRVLSMQKLVDFFSSEGCCTFQEERCVSVI